MHGKINLFICSCKGKIDLPDDLNFGDDVTMNKHDFLCSEEGKKLVLSADGNIVIAGCTERVAEKFFAQNNITIANIREQGSFISASKEKIKDIIAGAIARAREKDKIEKEVFEINNKSVLVIGSGIAGLE
jgi:heterodisulfide reductase subunit A-like polyferredoxin